MMRPMGWLGILRLGLVQAGLGSVVVLATSTLNRVMVVELALPALIPGALVPLHRGFDRLRWATPILHQSPRSWRYRGKRAPAWLGPFGW